MLKPLDIKIKSLENRRKSLYDGNQLYADINRSLDLFKAEFKKPGVTEERKNQIVADTKTLLDAKQELYKTLEEDVEAYSTLREQLMRELLEVYTTVKTEMDL